MFSLRLDFMVWLWARYFVPTNKNLSTAAHNESSPVLLCDNSLGSVISLFQHGSAPVHKARSIKHAYGLEQGLRAGRYQPASVLDCPFGQVSKVLGGKPETTADVGADEWPWMWCFKGTQPLGHVLGPCGVFLTNGILTALFLYCIYKSRKSSTPWKWYNRGWASIVCEIKSLPPCAITLR